MDGMNDGLRARYESEAGARAYAAKYDGRWSRRLSNRRELRLLRWALEAAGRAPGAGGTILDVPCAAGRLVPVLLAYADRVTAVDLSPAMVAVASAALHAEIAAGRALVGEGDAAALRFDDGAFDTVVSWRLLHHLTDRPTRIAILRELARTARRAVIVTFADASTWRARFQRWRGRNRRCQKLTHAEFSAEALEAGLSTLAIRRLASPFSLVAAAALRPLRPEPTYRPTGRPTPMGV